MKAVVLTRGRIATVDDEDFDRVNQFKWCAQRTTHQRGYYAVRAGRKPDGSRDHVYLHNYLLGLKGVDHRNGDGLDNRRQNLRVTTHQQNQQGFQKKRRNTSSQFRGVHWDRFRERWGARIKLNGRSIYLGRFTDETEAARAYDTAAHEHFGEFASPNFPA